jgi:hypothetical protein
MLCSQYWTHLSYISNTDKKKHKNLLIHSNDYFNTQLNIFSLSLMKIETTSAVETILDD